MITKRCSKCKLEKQESNFPKDSHTKDGFHPSCKECRKIAKHNSYIKHKDSIIRKQSIKRKSNQEWINQHKRYCEDCGEDHIACLDFHHIDDKEHGIADLINRHNLTEDIKNTILQEIQKCIVLCSNCHRKRHWKEKLPR